jgi:hypothetical protein
MLLLSMAAMLAGCAMLEQLLVARGDYGSASGMRGEVGIRF